MQCMHSRPTEQNKPNAQADRKISIQNQLCISTWLHTYTDFVAVAVTITSWLPVRHPPLNFAVSRFARTLGKTGGASIIGEKTINIHAHVPVGLRRNVTAVSNGTRDASVLWDI